MNRPVVFVSYTQVDRAWAEWVAWWVEQAGYEVRVQAWHAVPGTNWVSWTWQAARDAQHTLLVVSAEALRSEYVESEWTAAFREDPRGTARRLIPVQVAACPLPGQLDSLTRIDLTDLGSEERASEALLAGLRAAVTGSGRPLQAPGFPGGPAPESPAERRSDAARPPFPRATGTASFADRVREACADRYPGADIQPVAPTRDAALHLDVTWDNDGYRRRWPVGLAPAGMDQATLTAFVEQVHARYEQTDRRVESELVHGGDLPEDALVRAARRRGVLVRSLREYQRLWDPRRYLAAQRRRLEADPEYASAIYVPQRFLRLDDPPDARPRPDVFGEVVDWLDAESARVALVLGDFGHGKTFLLRELARRIPAILPNLVPVVIELRALEKTYRLEQLLAAHLSRNREDVIDVRAVLHMLASGQLLLMFDGFDELALRVDYDRAAEHLGTLLSAVAGRAKVVITSRVQHFAADQQVRSALGQQVHLVTGSRLLRLADFDQAQIREFLVRLHQGDEAQADARLGLLHEIKDLLGLSRNPRMLSFIADLPVAELTAIRDSRGEISAAALYEKLLDRWLRFETARRLPTRATPLTLDPTQLRQAATAVALELWRSGEDGVDLPVLATATRSVLADLTRLRMEPGQATHTVGSGSLLVRQDDDRFGFVHSSVQEYLIADETARRLGAGESAGTGPLGGREMSPLMVDFLCDALRRDPAARERAVGWAATTLSTRGAPDAAVANAIAISGRLEVRTGRRRASLAGQDLRGRDLSGLDLRGADLSGTDLRGARLAGLDLTEASLRGAQVVRASLDEVTLARADLSHADLTGAVLRHADLGGADLSQADFTGATVLGGSLAGAKLTGGRWAEAAVIGAALDASAHDTPELRPALIANRERLVPQVHPYHEAGDVVYLLGGRLLAAAHGPVVLLIDPVAARALRVLPLAADSPTRLAATADGGLLVIATGGTVRMWDLRPDAAAPSAAPAGDAGPHSLPGRLVSTVDLPSPVVALAVDRSGRHAVAVDQQEGAARLLDLSAGKMFEKPLGGGETVAVSPDGRLVALGLRDRASRTYGVRVQELPSGQEAHWLPHEGRVRDVQFGRDGGILVTVSDAAPGSGDTLTVWRLGPQVTRSSHRTQWSGPVAFHPTSSLLAQAESNGVVVWDLSSGQKVVEPRTSGSIRFGSGLAFHPDGTEIACSTATGVELIPLVVPGAGDDAVAPVGQRQKVYVGRGRPVGPAARTENLTFRSFAGVAFVDEGRRVRTLGPGTIVRTWDKRTGALLSSRRVNSPGRYRGTSLLSGDGRTAVAAGDGQVVVTDCSGDEMEKIAEHRRPFGQAAAALSPDGSLLAVTSYDEVAVIRTASGRPPWGWAGPMRRRRLRSTPKVSFSPDNRHVAMTDFRRTTVSRIGTRAGSRTIPLAGPIAFSPDGHTLAGLGHDREAIELWNHRDGRATGVLTAPAGSAANPHALAFSSDGGLLAAAVHDRIHVWEVAAGACRHTLAGHLGQVRAIAFDPAGALLASTGDDGTLRLWDTDTGRERVALLDLPDDGWAALLPDGSYKLAGDPAGVFWWALGLRRFEPGELDAYLPSIRRLPDDAPLDLP
ncbi:TIR domain-containing protein [Frankia sp. CNm7]|uniref:TIR domain-containing protein n=1 Tax=Frankia nepalensis TaxID=1836974 RepID=A0A937RPZ3_9ACTN|nr:TIR domain-containing protein [Frankia nepalensis]MBL7498620.1 TIR domain-containing protein [Frankia nepalensis]MBL7510490.1 TIR domain-containing protein [Frankia nepalensis]MBL7517171.1 TIR domain-containing protein [Frankia nepalensis]MBL7630503.1 TIR domain-containing protein [Frankia nepalensis]